MRTHETIMESYGPLPLAADESLPKTLVDIADDLAERFYDGTISSLDVSATIRGRADKCHWNAMARHVDAAVEFMCGF